MLLVSPPIPLISILSLLILLLLPILPSSAALLFCHSDPKVPPPSASDCHYIFAHLPPFPLPSTHNDVLTSNSSPILTPSDFVHDTCFIMMNYGHASDRAVVPLTQEMWGFLRASVDRILSRCVDRHEEGMETFETPTMLYAVYICKASMFWTEGYEPQYEAMHWVEGMPLPPPREDRFRGTLYYV